MVESAGVMSVAEHKGNKKVATCMVHRPLVEEVCWNDLLYDMLEDRLAELVSRDVLRVLSGDDNRVYAERDCSTTILLVLDGDLGLRIGSQPREGT